MVWDSRNLKRRLPGRQNAGLVLAQPPHMAGDREPSVGQPDPHILGDLVTVDGVSATRHRARLAARESLLRAGYRAPNRVT